jgi:hypothetical protein
MRATTATLIPATSRAFRTILWGGLACGILDITSAIIITALIGRSPIRMLQSISRGLLGEDAYNGGIPIAVLGMVLHFVIAFTATIIFYMASRKLKFLTHTPILWGPLYGIAVYFFMNFVVLPLSAFPNKLTYTSETLAIGLGVHMLCVGLPIAVAISQSSNTD